LSAFAALICFAGLNGCSERASDASSDAAQLRHGVSLADRGDYRGAISTYDLVLGHKPQNAEAVYLRGSARDRLGDRVGALADYDTALRLDARLLPAYVARAAIHAERGDSAAAAADYRSARELQGNDQVH